MAVNDKIDLTFATGLRSFLRHDPDVIMVGEIRDLPTAEIAIQASLTGHLVLSTIHTNDAAGAITRLVELGVQPFLVATSLVGLLAQRLVRRVCPECRSSTARTTRRSPASGSTRRTSSPAGPGGWSSRTSRPRRPGMVYLAREGGCTNCLGAGYRGRTAIYELLMVDDTIRQLANKNTDGPTIKKAAVGRGLRTLRDDGAQKVLAGMTTAAEVLMMTAEDVD